MTALIHRDPTVAADSGAEDSIGQAMATARSAQVNWSALPLAIRLKKLRCVRALIAEQAIALAESAAILRPRSVAEILTSEVLPLAEACRFLERTARKTLQPRRLGPRGRPFWLGGLRSEIHREPHGVVLLIGPGNYPLFLPGVQMLQALAAGNAVLIKPGHGGGPAAAALARLLANAGLDSNLCQVLPEKPAAAQAAIRCGVDKVFLTGNTTTGEAVLHQCAATLTPATVELSGCDALIVRADADLDLVVRSLAFGLRLNGSATCIAPRRVLVHPTRMAELADRLSRRFPPDKNTDDTLPPNPHLAELLRETLAAGARLLTGSIASDGSLRLPLIFTGVTPEMRLVREDIFAPVLSLLTVANDEEAIAFAAQCPYALSATLFSRDEAAARSLAARLRVGGVIINDVIVPTADPRLPFGGRGRSGFGVTRGSEGLLEMTAPKVLSVRRGKARPHLDAPHAGDAALFTGYIRAAHGRGWRARWQGLTQILNSLKHRSNSTDHT